MHHTLLWRIAACVGGMILFCEIGELSMTFEIHAYVAIHQIMCTFIYSQDTNLPTSHWIIQWRNISSYRCLTILVRHFCFLPGDIRYLDELNV
jgi:hypothetical protein